MPLVTMLLIESGWDAEWITFWAAIYNACAIVGMILTDNHLGSFGATQIAQAQTTVQQTTSTAADNIKAADNQEIKDVIEAKKRKITVEQLKEEKYGDPAYDYGKTDKAEEERQEKLEDLRKMMAELEAGAPTPIPPPPEPIPVVAPIPVPPVVTPPSE